MVARLNAAAVGAIKTPVVRDRLTSGLVSIEDGLREIRRRLTEAREEAKQLPGYAEAVALHHDAITLVTKILGSDKASLDSLASAELVRRDSLRALEQGETTLSAYRKVVSLSTGATLAKANPTQALGALQKALKADRRVEIRVPPLRERRSDVRELSTYFLERHRGARRLRLSDAALQALIDYDWPGNVRELECLVNGRWRSSTARSSRSTTFHPG